jgi:hypothetical protein
LNHPCETNAKQVSLGRRGARGKKGRGDVCFLGPVCPRERSERVVEKEFEPRGARGARGKKEEEIEPRGAGEAL